MPGSEVNRSADDPAVQLHILMSRLRAARTEGTMAYNMAQAQHEADASPVNQAFLDAFFELLPISFESESYGSDARHAIVGDKEALPATLAMTVASNIRGKYHNYKGMGFVVGERAESRKATRVLLALAGVVGTDLPGEVHCMEASVHTAKWKGNRAKMLGSLTALDAQTMIDLHDPARELYRVPHTDLVQVDTTLNRRSRGLAVRADRASGYRPLRSSDFMNFNAGFYLQAVAAAFDREEELAGLLQARNVDLPPAPEVSALGMPDNYRQITEATYVDPNA